VKRRQSRHVLQWIVFIGGLVPVLGGLYGIISNTDSHYAYLSGLLLGIGLAFWDAARNIEHHRMRFRLLTAIVFIGGLARLYVVIRTGQLSAVTLFALTMELAVTPLLCRWQNTLALTDAQ